jgi:hypothetical protein
VWVGLIFFFGASDRITVFFGASYVVQLWVYRVLVFVAPLVAGVVTYRLCNALRAREIVERHKHEAEHEAADAAKRGTPIVRA